MACGTLAGTLRDHRSCGLTDVPQTDKAQAAKALMERGQSAPGNGGTRYRGLLETSFAIFFAPHRATSG